MAVKIAKGFWLYPATFGRLMHAACAYGNLEAFEILVRAGMPVDKPLCQPPNPFYFQQDEDWTPMMVALTSTKGQRLIVPRLIELGVEEVSRTQTRFWRAFELGVYPQTMHARQSAESGEVIEDLQPNAGLNLLDLQQTGIWGRDF
ncbi:hypothetical protein GQ53DRAFT_751627 [Thozetella sp. PMI_491]|nr:hypothetical protein GQ53DRAFT_751627 [Thozetella sp. PMI_491]